MDMRRRLWSAETMDGFIKGCREVVPVPFTVSASRTGNSFLILQAGTSPAMHWD
jgi:hypothetical protein